MRWLDMLVWILSLGMSIFGVWCALHSQWYLFITYFIPYVILILALGVLQGGKRL